MSKLIKVMLVCGFVFSGSAIAQSSRTAAQNEAVTRECERFFGNYRNFETLSPSSQCALPDRLRVFGNANSRRAFMECYEFMADHRTGEVSPPSSVCLWQSVIAQRSTPARRRAHDACHMFMESHRQGEVDAPSAVCTNPRLVEIFGNTEHAKLFTQCIEARAGNSSHCYSVAVGQIGVLNAGTVQQGRAGTNGTLGESAIVSGSGRVVGRSGTNGTPGESVRADGSGRAVVGGAGGNGGAGGSATAGGASD